MDGKYVLYLDYDKLNLDDVELELAFLQKQYNIGDILLFESSKGNYHAISFDKFSAKEFIEILENSSVDFAFKNFPRFYGFRNWVLRFAPKGTIPKPIYLKTLKYARNNRMKSLGHYNLIRTLYPEINLSKLYHSDNINEVKIISYKTGKY
jgi:hypothetical protein